MPTNPTLGRPVMFKKDVRRMTHARFPPLEGEIIGVIPFADFLLKTDVIVKWENDAITKENEESLELLD